MERIACGPIVEVLGDEMAQVLWGHVKEKLIEPYVEMNTIEFDLSITNRDSTDNLIVNEVIEAIKKYKVCLKCATKTADAKYVQKYNLHREYPSVTISIRNALGGITLREGVLFPHASPKMRLWKYPITIIFLSVGDLYECLNVPIPGAGTLELVYTPNDSAHEVIRRTVHKFDGAGVAAVMVSTEESIEHFAIKSFEYALKRRQPLYFSAIESILTVYDGRFATIFRMLYERVYECKFTQKNICYKYIGVNRMAKHSLLSNGEFVWALKNYDGDVFSSMVTSAYGMISSLFVGHEEEQLISETFHGAPTQVGDNKGVIPGFNPTETIVAWTLALKYRAKLDNNEKLLKFAKKLEASFWEAIKFGFVTTDLAQYMNAEDLHILNAFEYIDKVAHYLESHLAMHKEELS